MTRQQRRHLERRAGKPPVPEFVKPSARIYGGGKGRANRIGRKAVNRGEKAS